MRTADASGTTTDHTGEKSQKIDFSLSASRHLMWYPRFQIKCRTLHVLTQKLEDSQKPGEM